MDWLTIRVLSNNLGELLAQRERGDHIKVEEDSRGVIFERVTPEWRVGILGMTVSLAKALNVSTEEFDRLHPSALIFHMDVSPMSSYYVRQAVALVALARKLLADLDAAHAASTAAKPATERGTLPGISPRRWSHTGGGNF